MGSVISVSAGIVKVMGLPGTGFEELLKFPNGLFGIAYNIDEDSIGAILLGDDSLLNAGDEVERTGRVMDIPVDECPDRQGDQPSWRTGGWKGLLSHLKKDFLLNDQLLLLWIVIRFHFRYKPD